MLLSSGVTKVLRGDGEKPASLVAMSSRGSAAPHRLPLLQPQDVVDSLDQSDDHRLPGHQVAQPVQQLPIHDVRPLPAGQEGVKEPRGNE